MRRITLFCAAISLLLPAGCVSYPVRFNGYVAPSSQMEGSLFTRGQTFYVLEEEKPENPLFSEEIRSKIGTLLQENGYTLGSRDDARYFLAFGSSMQQGTVSGIRPEYYPPQTGTIHTYTDNGTIRSSFIQYPGFTTYYPYRYTVYTSTFRLEALEAQPLRASKEKKVVWIGESHLTSQNSDLRETINYLLVATFNHFGSNTRRSITENLTPRDPRVKRLF